MLKNYLTTAWRNLISNIRFSLINIIGLAIGMGSAILILLWIQNEVSHDRFHEKKDRIYVANNRDKIDGEIWAWNTTPKPLAPALRQDYPEVEDVVRVDDDKIFLFTVGDKHMNLLGSAVDSGFLKMFSFPLIAGNTDALKETNSIVITQKMAIKLFGMEDVLGKTLKVDSTDQFTISGVLKDLPNNTAFNFEYLIPWSYQNKINRDQAQWGNNNVTTYILLKPGVSQASFDAKIKNITINHNRAENATNQVFTQLLSDSWLYSKAKNGVYVGGRIEKVKLFGLIAGFILLIACINFMNLSTARSEKRAKEVGIRKVSGATKELLILQFIAESIILSLLAGILAILLVELSLPSFNQLVGKELYIAFSNGSYWFFALLFILFTGLLAGSYPAFHLSSYQPVKVLKGTVKAGSSVLTPRKVLVVLQFTFAIALIICTIIVQQQIKFAQSRDTGYARGNLIYVNIQGDIDKNYELIKQELLNKSAAKAVTKSLSPITQSWSDNWGFSWPGSTEADKKVDFIQMSSDADFVKTMGVKLLEGRDIDSRKYASDSTALLLNETAVQVMRLKNPIGAIVKYGSKSWHVVGVLKDFIYGSPYEKVEQLVVQGPASWFSVVHIKLNPANTVTKSLGVVSQVFKKYNSQYPFDYQFVDQKYAKKFEDENRVGILSALFAGLTIFISCLGLFGLATYVAENRIKEIGIRKVLGASVSSITTLLSLDFLKLVIVSLLIASPIAWFAMHKWLEGYTYRVSIGWGVFALAGSLSILIAVGTITFQTIKAALSNPVKSLRN